MKSFNEWLEEKQPGFQIENVNEIFGLFNKAKPEETPHSMRPPNQKEKAYCPFCKDSSAVLISGDETGHPNRMLWHCTKCYKEWDKDAVDSLSDHEEFSDGKGPGLIRHKPVGRTLVGGVLRTYLPEKGYTQGVSSNAGLNTDLRQRRTDLFNRK